MKSFPSSLNSAAVHCDFIDDYSFGNSADRAESLGLNVNHLDFNLSLDSSTIVDLHDNLDITTSVESLHDISNDTTLDTVGEYSLGFEDAIKLAPAAIKSLNTYKFIYKYSVVNRGNVYQKSKNSSDVAVKLNSSPGTPALFNPLFSINARGFMKALPLLYWNDNHQGSSETVAGKTQLGNDTYGKSDYNGFNLGDCSIRRLVSLSEESLLNKGNAANASDPVVNIMGLSLYRYADFMYCKDLGKCSNNHLITLRKFPYPVGDNIFIGAIPKAAESTDLSTVSEETLADVGRLVTWFGTEDNKLEDIMSYEMKTSWKELSAKIQQENSQADSNNRPLNVIMNSLNPQYNSMQAGGFTKGANIWSHLGSNGHSWTGKLLGTNGTYDNTTLRNYDENKVYTPKNTIQDTLLYEGKLTYTQEFTLNFCYKLRAYDNINGKSAFLDLLGNILEVTYRRGKFWGGSRKIIGPPDNTSGWRTANAFINNTWDKLGGFMEALFRGNIDFSSLLASASELVSNAYNQGKEITKSAMNGGVAALGGKFVDAFKNFDSATNLSNGLKGQLLNGLGRPSLYAWNSLLSASNVGLWHVTIGNPLNPIAAFGNMVITGAKVTHSGPLGIDDFPTELKVSVTLKHARSRDVTEIGKMYTRGTGALYNPLAQNAMSKYLNMTASGAEKIKKIDDENSKRSKEMYDQAVADKAAAKQANDKAKTKQETDNSNLSDEEKQKQETEKKNKEAAEKRLAEKKAQEAENKYSAAQWQATMNDINKLNKINSQSQDDIEWLDASNVNNILNKSRDLTTSGYCEEKYLQLGCCGADQMQLRVDESA